MWASIKPLLLLGAAFLLCQPVLEAAQAGKAPQYKTLSKSTKTQVNVTIVWAATAAEVDAICSKLLDRPATGSVAACYVPVTNTIYAVEPTDFNDDYHLMILGHEIWHSIGADHAPL